MIELTVCIFLLGSRKKTCYCQAIHQHCTTDMSRKPFSVSSSKGKLFNKSLITKTSAHQNSSASISSASIKTNPGPDKSYTYPTANIEERSFSITNSSRQYSMRAFKELYFLLDEPKANKQAKLPSAETKPNSKKTNTSKDKKTKGKIKL